MTTFDYRYTVEECDVPDKGELEKYREFRCKCLKRMFDLSSDTSVVNQMYNLTWHTAVFKTLNEAIRLEPERFNKAFWELTSAGYVSLITSGIRRLVDKDSRTNSILNVVSEVESRPEMLTREKFICYDGLPYDFERAEQREDITSLVSVDSRGPKAWRTSKMMHGAFDKLSGNLMERQRLDKIRPCILQNLKAGLSHNSIEKVCKFVNKRVAHNESNASALDTRYDDIDNALKQIVRIVSFISSSLFYAGAFTSIVPTPQHNVLKGWDETCESMNVWIGGEHDEFMSTCIK